MRFAETAIPGAWLVELDVLCDERGWFARTFCREEFSAQGLEPAVAQCNTSFNERAGTLRGMHWQAPPHCEAKLIRCTRGAIYDVIVDLRQDSPAYRRWVAVELSAENGRMLYVPPEEIAHGFQTLLDASEVHYQMSHDYVPGAGRGVRFDDPVLGIEWPEAERVVSPRDRSHPAVEP